MATKKRTSQRKPARRSQAKQGEERLIPGWFLVVFGLVMGAGLSLYLIYFTDVLPEVPEGNSPRPQPTEVAQSNGTDLSDDIGSDDPEWKPTYDFYSVLPEMEVVIPEDELAERAERQSSGSAAGPHYLQTGSFQTFNDAERMKAQLALIGLSAKIQSAQVNGATWYRVRVGPYDSQREADRVRRQLLDNNFAAERRSGQQ